MVATEMIHTTTAKMLSVLLTVLLSLLLMFFSQPVQAQVQARVDRNPVALDESFTLTIDSSEDGDPDLKPLQRDFEILSQSKSSSFQIINGNTSRKISWQITLMPKRDGQLQIPALSLNGKFSPALGLIVTAKNSKATAQSGSQLFIEASAEPRSAYVQQQIIFTVRMYRTVNLGNGSSLSEPKFPEMDAVIEKLGQDREFQANKNGQNYIVLERRYAIYPQKSGQFNSDPIQFDGTVVNNAMGGGIFPFDPFNQRGSHLRARSETVQLSVKPQPAQFSGSQWLPATKLSLTESWSQNPPVFTVGEPITRTLTLTAEGQVASQIVLPASTAIDGFKFYPDQATLKNTSQDQGNIGIREQKIALIPTRPGNFELPEISVKWWNTATETEEIARIPARSITVMPAAAGQNQSNTPAAVLPDRAATPPAVNAATPDTSTSSDSRMWQILALVLGLGWLLTGIAWWRSSRKPTPAKNITPHTETIQSIEKQIKRSCLENKPADTSAHLLAWAKLRWPQHPPTSLTTLAQHCQPDLAQAVLGLDQSLYGKDQASWNGTPLWKLFEAHRFSDQYFSTEPDDGLEALYKT